jgi:hypothetical protein
MTTFHSRQSDRGRRVQKMASARGFNSTPQIAPSIYTVMFTEHDKSAATIFNSLCKRRAVSKCFYRVEALPLVWTRILRLAQISPLDARSPARRPRDDREISGKTSGEISRRKSALCADNGRAVTTATPSNVRQVGSQDNSRCAAVIQAVVAPGTCGTTSKTAAQQPCHGSRNGQSNISQDNLLKS